MNEAFVSPRQQIPRNSSQQLSGTCQHSTRRPALRGKQVPGKVHNHPHNAGYAESVEPLT